MRIIPKRRSIIFLKLLKAYCELTAAGKHVKNRVAATYRKGVGNYDNSRFSYAFGTLGGL